MIDVDRADFTLGIVGAGAMGSGIAQVALMGGIAVVLVDVDEAPLAKARAALFQRLDRLAEKDEMPEPAVAAAKARLKVTTALEALAPCGVVIEAIVERLEVKRELFTKLEAIVAADAVIASNTSSLPIASIARVCAHRERIAGMHFFNPVPLMRLVEVIAAADTAQWVTGALARLGERLGRTPVVVKDGPGFLVNFGGRPFPQEALHILTEGAASPAQIDAVMRDCCGFRMGPFELLDFTGIDVNFPVAEIIHRGYFYDPRYASRPWHESLFEAGRLGRKSGAGFHRYDAKGQRIEEPEPAPTQGAKPRRVILPIVDERLVKLAAAAGVPAEAHDDGESPILVAPLGNDCTTTCVEEGLDPRRTVAVDCAFDTHRRITVMMAPGGDAAIGDSVAALLAVGGRAVTRIRDCPGFIAQRIVAMIANLGAEMAQMGLATPADIDKAMQLGLNYPMGPLAFADTLGVKTTYEIVQRLFAITGSDRYRPSLWLRRRALLGLSATTPD